MGAIDHRTTYTQRSFRNIPHRARLRWLRSTLSDLGLDGVSYADVGCSTGFVTAELAHTLHANDPVGFDHLAEHLEVAGRRHPGIAFRLLDLNQHPVRPPAFQVVTCLETLEHVGSIDHALDNLVAMTAPGGYLFISVPIENGPWGLVKLAVKSTIARRPRQLAEVFGTRRRLRRELAYVGRLLTNRRVSTFRTAPRQGWSSHFGFDHRDLADRLQARHLCFTSSARLSTRLFVVRPGEVPSR